MDRISVVNELFECVGSYNITDIDVYSAYGLGCDCGYCGFISAEARVGEYGFNIFLTGCNRPQVPFLRVITSSPDFCFDIVSMDGDTDHFFVSLIKIFKVVFSCLMAQREMPLEFELKRYLLRLATHYNLRLEECRD